MNEENPNDVKTIKTLKMCYEFNKRDLETNPIPTMYDFLKGRLEQTKVIMDFLGVKYD